ncbi:MAG: DUF4258 domain-containing protein [Chitinophagaceae bacterium]|jgi:hypothetical protein
MKKAFPYIVLAILAVLVLVIKTCKTPSPKIKKNEDTNKNEVVKERGLNRNPSHINYSKHARCRMDCRKVTQREIEDILQNGNINYRKSELQGNDCSKKYAVEGYSKQDNQHLRIIFAPCNNEVTVVTCIDLDVDYECTCN